MSKPVSPTGPVQQATLRGLPGVDRLLDSPGLRALLEQGTPRTLVVRALRAELAELRAALLRGDVSLDLDEHDWALHVARRCRALRRGAPRPVINATGVVIHTNLGRAPLAAEALAAMQAAARSYCDLEYDLEAGTRGSRHDHAAELLREITGAEDAVVVNNNAAAVLLATAALAAGGEVLVSRSELIEIGGSFRIPDVIAQGGARLREVGTSNRTHLRDYEAALRSESRGVLKVHRSNFWMDGFVAEVSGAELAGLAHGAGIWAIEDLGSGCLVDLAPWGLPREPRVQDSVAAGLDLVTFSGDKLVGGPQAGFAVGRRAAVERLRRHPLMRALRPDKATLAGVVATLALYREGRAEEALPVYRMLLAGAATLRARATAFAEGLRERLPAACVELRDAEAPAGGGALPGQLRPVTWVLLRPPKGESDGAQRLERALRGGEWPVVARIHDGSLCLDLRCVAPDEEEPLLAALQRAWSVL